MNSKFNKKVGPAKGPKNLILMVLFVVGSLTLLTKLVEESRAIKPLPFSTFMEKVEQGLVADVRVNGHEVAGHLKDGTVFETVTDGTFNMSQFLYGKGIDFGYSTPVNFNFWHMLALMSLFMAPLAIWYMVRASRSNNNGGAGIFSMGKSKAKMFMPSTIKENFDSVAGVTEAKEELKDVVDFLKNPEKYKRLGAKITRGVLLIGEPGNGKTMLARAVAGEANCPFFSISGSDFIEVFVGVGAARVRDLFAQARKHAPSIIFIDEIDAVGRHRGGGLGGGHDEREQTLNQLLTEMDGFDNTGESIIVMAATNRPDVLDKALLRPGRFDRHVEVPFPDLMSREKILEVHMKRIKANDDINIKKIARGTPGFSGADLANLINEAAIIASKLNKKNVSMVDFEEARDKVLLGKESKTIMLTDEDRRITAFHEGGHALMNLLLPFATDPLHKVTIIPRGRALGVTHSLPEREKYNQTKDEMLGRIQVCLGGRVAEEVVFGMISTGAYSDFKSATDIARRMVCRFGMSEELGLAVYGTDEQGYPTYSQETASAIDTQVKVILKECYQKVTQLIQENRDKLDILAEKLLEKETLEAGEIYALLGIEPRQEFKLI